MDKFGPKRQNCLNKMKHDTETNSDMLNPISVFICPIFQPEIPFFCIFCPQNQNSLYKLLWCVTKKSQKNPNRVYMGGCSAAVHSPLKNAA